MTNPAIEVALSYFFCFLTNQEETSVRTARAGPSRFTVLNGWAMLCRNRVRKPIGQTASTRNLYLSSLTLRTGDLSKWPERLGWRYAHYAVDGMQSKMLIRRGPTEHQCHVRILDRVQALVSSHDADLQRR
jgi:hypothetical protein